jgi:membrane protein implicated in regulation of membrane protease activity
MQPIVDYFAVHSLLFWIACFSIAGILEVSIPSFTFIFVSLAALVAGLISLRWGWPVQVGTFGTVLLVSASTLRPFLLSHKRRTLGVHSRVDVLLGKVGKVTEAIDGPKGMGRIVVEGQDWAAKSQDVIAVGKQIVVESSDSIVLIVRKA